MELAITNNSRQKCSLCHRTIPKDVRRISFPYNTQFGVSFIRLCGRCICKMAESLKNDKAIKEWDKKIMIKEGL